MKIIKTLINAYINTELYDNAFGVLKDAKKSELKITDISVYKLLLDACEISNRPEMVPQIYDDAKSNEIQFDLEFFEKKLKVLLVCKKVKEGIEVFEEMKAHGIEAVESTFKIFQDFYPKYIPNQEEEVVNKI